MLKLAPPVHQFVCDVDARTDSHNPDGEDHAHELKRCVPTLAHEHETMHSPADLRRHPKPQGEIPPKVTIDLGIDLKWIFLVVPAERVKQRQDGEDVDWGQE